MTGENGPATEAEFDEELSELLREAFANGVDVEGGWDVRTGDGPDWTVEVTRVQSED